MSEFKKYNQKSYSNHRHNNHGRNDDEVVIMSQGRASAPLSKPSSFNTEESISDLSSQFDNLLSIKNQENRKSSSKNGIEKPWQRDRSKVFDTDGIALPKSHGNSHSNRPWSKDESSNFNTNSGLKSSISDHPQNQPVFGESWSPQKPQSETTPASRASTRKIFSKQTGLTDSDNSAKKYSIPKGFMRPKPVMSRPPISTQRNCYSNPTSQIDTRPKIPILNQIHPSSNSTNSYSKPKNALTSHNDNDLSWLEPQEPSSAYWTKPTEKMTIKGPYSHHAIDSSFGQYNEGYTANPSANTWGLNAGMGVLGEKNVSGSSGINSSSTNVNLTGSNLTDSIKEIFDTFDKVEEEEEEEGEEQEGFINREKEGSDSAERIKHEEKIERKKRSLKEGKVKGLNVQLMDHQIQGVKFLKKREGSKIKYKGGLLCDDMGLGKTVQSIALILSNPYKKPSDDSKKTEKLYKGTLVVAPVSLIYQWKQEISDKAPGLSVHVYHGPSRDKDAARTFRHSDVVLTTFQIVGSESSDAESPLFLRKWWRIIVDEAHTIKNRKTKMTQGCYLLRSDRRWCLTGTPIQNSLDELQSLIQFLRIGPYDDYQLWTSQISRPLNSGDADKAIARLHTVLRAIMLRRTKAVLKENKSNGLKMKERRVNRVNIQFSKGERNVYDSFEKRAIAKLRELGMQDNKSYMTALVLLLRLRQVCDHSSLALKNLSAGDREALNGNVSTKTGEDAEIDDDLADMLGGLSITKNKNNEYAYSLEATERQPSSKMIKLLEYLNQEKSRKTIVFSQFTSFLDVIGPFLKKNGIKAVCYYGSMPPIKREEALNSLRNDSSVTVLLCSLKAGALGLNLTCASRVMIMDPWWNPMVNEQAIDRVHRIGQTRDVDVYEFMVLESVEERIMALQEKKRQLHADVIEGAASGKKSTFSAAKLSLQDLMQLFKL